MVGVHGGAICLQRVNQFPRYLAETQTRVPPVAHSKLRQHRLVTLHSNFFQSLSTRTSGLGRGGTALRLRRYVAVGTSEGTTPVPSEDDCEGSQLKHQEKPWLTQQQSVWLLNVLALGYGGTAVLVKIVEGTPMGAESLVPGVADCTASLAFVGRFVAATAVFLPVFLWRLRSKRKALGGATAGQPQMEWASAVELGGWMFLTYAGQAIGLQSTSADHAALLGTVSVILVPFLARAAGGKIDRSVWIGTVMACAGMFLLECGGLLGASVGTGVGLPAGDWWCLLSAVASATHVVRAEALAHRADPLFLVTVQLATTAALALPWVLMDAAGHGLSLVDAWGGLAAVPWGIILLTGPMGTGLCEWLELEALRTVSAARATLILTMVPLWGGLLAYVTLGEALEGSALLGGAIILLASLEVQLFSPKGQGEGEAEAEAEAGPQYEDPLPLLIGHASDSFQATPIDPSTIVIDEQIVGLVHEDTLLALSSHLVRQDPLPAFADDSFIQRGNAGASRTSNP